MGQKTFSVVTTISMIWTSAIAILSILGITITGVYPGIFVLVLIAVIPIASRYYATKLAGKSQSYQKKFYTTFTIINLLLILIVLWMSFVIFHDRILDDDVMYYQQPHTT